MASSAEIKKITLQLLHRAACWKAGETRAFGGGEHGDSEHSVAGVLPAHNAENTCASKAQQRLGKLVNRVRCERHVASLDQVPHTTPQRGTGDPQVEKATKGLATTRQRNQSGPGAAVFFGARPVDSSRDIPASEFMAAGRRFLGIKEFLGTGCPCCGAAGANTRHARLCHDRTRRLTSTSPWSTRSTAPFRGCPCVVKGKRAAPFPRKRGFYYRHRHRGERTPRCYGIEVSQQSDIARRHVCGPTRTRRGACAGRRR